MSITTKKGDDGKTSLYWGPRISKDHPRVEMFGTLDELCSYLGLAKSLLRDAKDKKLIESVQRDLFVLGAEVATTAKYIDKLDHRIDKDYVGRLEKIIGKLESTRKFDQCCFYLPGQNPLSSTLDVARTVARRAERRVTTLRNRNMVTNRWVLIYLNRLSDLLYLLARSFEGKSRRLKYR